MLSRLLTKLKIKSASAPIPQSKWEAPDWEPPSSSSCDSFVIASRSSPLDQPTLPSYDDVCKEKTQLPIPTSQEHPASENIRVPFGEVSRMTLLPIKILRIIMDLLDKRVLKEFDMLCDIEFVQNGPSFLRYTVPLAMFTARRSGRGIRENAATRLMLGLLQRRRVPEFNLGWETLCSRYDRKPGHEKEERSHKYQDCRSGEGCSVHGQIIRCDSWDERAGSPCSNVRWTHTTEITCSYCGSTIHACQPSIICPCGSHH